MMQFRTVEIDGLLIFYREAGQPDRGTLLLLHGFPSSSFMFRSLIPLVADRFRVVAPDYPGFGHSSAPSTGAFGYSFDRLSAVVEAMVERLGLAPLTLYMHGYGAAVGLRLASRHPEWIDGLIVQNGYAYLDALTDYWKPWRPFWVERTPLTEASMRRYLRPEAVRARYTAGARDPGRLDSRSWLYHQVLLERAGNHEIQLDLFHDFRTNLARCDRWQSYLRAHRPPTLVLWGRHDPIYGVAGAEAFRRDLPETEVHLLDTGHFALEEDAEPAARHIRAFGHDQAVRPARPIAIGPRPVPASVPTLAPERPWVARPAWSDGPPAAEPAGPAAAGAESATVAAGHAGGRRAAPGSS